MQLKIKRHFAVSQPCGFYSIGSPSAFTLIELSIVLVIIGLIVGGVLTGRELIYQARLRKVGTELQQLSLAITTFRGKFDCLPGDCANATSFFGQSSTPCPSTTAGSSGTCNGSGDGFIEAWWLGGHGGTITIEALYGLQQLSLAKMFPGSFKGGDAAGRLGSPAQDLSGSNYVPISSFNPAMGYYPFTMDDALMGQPFVNKLVIQVGALTSNISNNDFLFGPAFTAPQASLIDSKLDDGFAGSGKIQNINPTAGGSAMNPNTTCLSGSVYSTSLTTGCSMFYAPDVP